MLRIAADENLHALFYRDILSAAITVRPVEAVSAIVEEVLAFDMPGRGSRDICARRCRSRTPASTTCASITTRS